MAQTMSAADMVVSRAGAITIAELTALGVPAILIPSPYVTANHQQKNAEALEKVGAAVIVKEIELKPDMLHILMKKLISDEEILKNMSFNSKKIGKLDATEKIYNIIEQLMSGSEQ
jgi:UDP-N-acetylglucosamine--N-acetylmuramyl-(pentapeptide) pyrophosphoryl-undecaprenol N-acetylglucosamine transferase